MGHVRSLSMPAGLGGDVEQRIAGGLAVAEHFGAHLQLLFTYVRPRQSILHALFGALGRKHGVALGDRPVLMAH